MAVKHSESKIYDVKYDVIYNLLKSPDFSNCINANFVENVPFSDYVEFRYVRKTTIWRYGRNHFIQIKKINEEQTLVSVTTQSRKVTVLIDTHYKMEISDIFAAIDTLIQE